jgi:Ca-activated chloride channel homolog
MRAVQLVSLAQSAQDLVEPEGLMMKVRLAAFCLLVCMPPQAGAQEVKPETLRIETALVTLSVGVSDKQGRPLGELTAKNFAIYEDGQPQTIEFFGAEDQPVSFGLLLDRSQSMGEAGKFERAKAAALAFLRAGNQQNEAFCLAFNETPTLVAGLTTDYPQIAQRLAELQPTGGTALYDAVLAGLERLKQAQHRRRVLIVITDGRDQHSRQSLAALVRRAQQSSTQIYTISFVSPVEAEAAQGAGEKLRLADGQMVDNPRLVFKTLAAETGAETFFPNSAPELDGMLAQLAANLRRQYTLAYYPSNQSMADSYRRITVKLQGVNGQVKTRQGYRLSEPLSQAAQAPPTPVAPAAPPPASAMLTPPKTAEFEDLPPPIFKETFDQLGAWPQTKQCYTSKGKYYVNGECLAPVGRYKWDDFELSVVAAVYSSGERRNERGLGVASEEVSLPTIGLSFRINEQGYYRLSLAPYTGGKEGVYKLTKVVQGQAVDVTSWRRDAAIGLRNEIKLRCVGDKLELRINVQRVAEFKVADHGAGQLALGFSGGLASFDDLIVKKVSVARP